MDVVPLREDPFEVDALPRILPRHLVEVGDERLLAVRYVRVVLDVPVPGVFFYRLRGLALVERQVVEGGDVPFVAFEGIVHRQLPKAHPTNSSPAENASIE
jgi:hypothetical protein